MSGTAKTLDNFYPVGGRGAVAPAFGLAAHPRAVPFSARALPVWACRIKRVEDLIIAAVALCLLLIPMVLIALYIRLDSPGPVLFRQWRIGLGGREFEVLKFRTMHTDCVEEATCRQATRGDPRVTRVGAWLRRFSVDELPQFFGSSAETVGASGVYRGLVLSLSRPAGGFVDNTSALPTTPQPPHRQKRRYHPPPRQASLRLIAADLRVCQEAEQLAAGRVEGALRGVGLTMGEQRPAIVADEGEDDLLDWPPPEVAVHLQSADDLTAESPDVVAVSAQGLA